MYTRSYRREKKKVVRWDIIVPIAIVVLVAAVVGAILLTRSDYEEYNGRDNNGDTTVNGGSEENGGREENGGERNGNGGEGANGGQGVREIEPGERGYLEVTQWGVGYRLAPGLEVIFYTLGSIRERNDTLNLLVREGCVSATVTRNREATMGGRAGVRIGELYYHAVMGQEGCHAELDRLIEVMIGDPVAVRGGARD